MAGRRYDEIEGVFTAVTNQTYASGTGFREPDVVTTYDGNATYLLQLRRILGDTGYESMAKFKATLQAEYNEAVKSVYKNKGFWVGRYETSGMVNSNPTTTDLANIPQVKVVAGAGLEETTKINQVTWYRMYGQQKKYAEKNELEGVGSGMILGAMHDQVLKFVETEDYNIIEVGNVAHNLEGVYQTGGLNYPQYPEEVEVAYKDYSKNIYDLEGNVWEWTTEANDSYFRVGSGRLLQR